MTKCRQRIQIQRGFKHVFMAIFVTFLQNHTVSSKSRRREKLAQTMLKLAELKNKMRSMSVSENFERQAYGSGNRLFKLARSRVTGREREYVPSVEDRLEDLAINEASGMKKMLKLERIVNAELKKINALKGMLDGFRRFYVE